MQINGNVISVNLNTKIAKKGGGSYDAWELVYRSPENEVKQLAKPVQSLKFTPGLKDGLSSLAPNDNFVAELEKNANDFWDVKSIRKADANEVVQQPVVQDSRPPAAVAATGGTAVPARGGKVTGSTYETAEERAKKQVVIVRQTSIDYAMKFLIAAGKEVTLDAVLDTAKEFEKHVQKDVGKAATKYLNIKIGDSE